MSVRAETRSVPNGFSTMTRAPVAQLALAELLHHQPEQHRRNGEVVRRALGRAELLADGLKRGRVVVVAVDVAQQAAELVEGRRIEPAVLLEAVLRPGPSWSRLQPALATPMTGTSRWPRLTIACSDGKIFLYARSPVAPKNTRASEWGLLIAGSFAPLTAPASFSRCPPNSYRIADSSLSAKSASPRELKRSYRAAVST